MFYNYYYEILSFMTELIFATALFLYVERRRKYFLFRFLCSAAVAYGVCALYSFVLYEFIAQYVRVFPYLHMTKYFLALFLCVGGAVICFDCSFYRILSCCMGGYAIQNGVYYINQLLRKFVDLGSDDVKRLVYYSIFFVIGVIVFLLTRKLRVSDSSSATDNLISALYSFVTIAVVIVLGTYNTGRSATVISIIYAVVLDATLLFVHIGIIQFLSYKNEARVYSYMLRTEHRQHQISEDVIESINIKYHDMRHQIAAVVLADDQMSKSDMLREIEESISVYNTITHTGNDALDIIIMETNLRCEKNKIRFTYIVDGALISFMDTLDIYSLFGNALENAVDSVKDLADNSLRFVNLEIRKKNDLIAVHIENYCGSKVTFSNGLPVSPRADTGFHGFGTRSIRNAVHKYHGNLLIYVKDNLFNIDIMFSGAAVQTDTN